MEESMVTTESTDITMTAKDGAIVGVLATVGVLAIYYIVGCVVAKVSEVVIEKITDRAIKNFNKKEAKSK